MSYKLCNTCFDVKELKNLNLFSKTNEQWNTFPLSLPILGKREGNQEIEIDMGKKNADCLIYYWASKTMTKNTHSKEGNAYIDSMNNGLIKLNSEGKGVININCPQPYQDKGISYMSHIHILVSDKKMTRWKKNISTQNVLCKINKKNLLHHMKLKDRLVINALSKEYYDKMKIPNSYNLDYKLASKMKPEEIKKELKNMIKEDKTIQKLIKKENLKLCEVPIIVYCYDKKCHAGHHLANQLFRAGFTNIIDYNEGVLGYFGRTRY